MIKFINILQAEIYKTKRTWNFSIMLLFPLLISLIIFGYFFVKISSNEISKGINIWKIYSRYFLLFYYLLYPILVAIITFSMSNIEHRNNGFKHLFTLPLTKMNLYFSKILILFFWILLSIIFAYALLMLSGNLLSMLFPEIGFQDYDISKTLLTFFARIFISLLAIASIHFFLSIYWDNFIVSVGSACFLVILASFISNWEYSHYIPYCNFTIALKSFFQNSTVIFSKEIIWSLAYSMFFLISGYFIMINKSIKELSKKTNNFKTLYTV